jgi:hypothetical protein
MEARKQSRETHHGGQEAEQKGALARYSPQGHAHSDLLPSTRPPLAFFHFPIMSSYYESIKGLNHSLGQSHQDLIISENSLTDTT